jgi:hypothetical protein
MKWQLYDFRVVIFMSTSSFEKNKFIVIDPDMIRKINKELSREKSGAELNQKRDDFDKTMEELKRGKELLKKL